MHEMMRIDNLGHGYRRGQWVLRRCDAVVERGSVFAVLGPNGRGKTTLLKLMLGLLQPGEGRVECHGTMAYVPQLFHAAFDYTVLDMVLMGRARQIALFAQPSRRDEAMALDALARLGLDGLAGRPFAELSGGQRQLVVFARALAAQADVLVLDEPTSALDLQNQSLVLGWMRRLAREDGITVVFTSHQPQHVLAVADRVMLMQDIDRHEVGPVAELLSEDRLTALYGVPMRRLAFEHGGRPMEALVPVWLDKGP